MKTRIPFVPIVIAVLASFAISSPALASRFYVVVGSFEEQSTASSFEMSIREMFPEASVIYDKILKMHHVYALETDRFDIAGTYRDHLRNEKGFFDAWIYADFKSVNSTDAAGAYSAPVALELYTGGKVLLDPEQNSYFVIDNKASRSDREDSNTQVPFTFVAKTANGIPIAGKVLLFDNRGEVITAFKTGQVVNLGGDYDKHALKMTFYADGYSPVSRVIDLGRLGNLPDVYLNGQEAWEVKFRAVKLHLGKINLLFDNLFYQQAAVLHPDSREAIDALAAMLKANAGWAIAINAHSADAEKRNFMLPGSSKNVFDLSDAVEKTGSAKHLTKKRAEVLEAYLVSKGVDSHRITALGWGNLDPLLKGEGVKAEVNERVEIGVATSW